MVADRISVRTHPGAVSAARPALDLEISGPGSLFWTRPGTLAQQGTEVTLWLRHELRDRPTRLQHDQEKCFQRLRRFFGYRRDEGEEEDQQDLDPGFIAAQHVVWPRYPVRVCPPKGKSWTIDDRFHVDHLAPIDSKHLAAKIEEWDYPADAVSEPHWELIDWTDDQAPEATGSRVRLWCPADSKAKKPLHPWELEAFVGAQIEEVLPRLLAQSMYVQNTTATRNALPLAPGVGWRAWIDLRGEAAPRLSVDRRTALPSKAAVSWGGVVTHVWRGFIDHLAATHPTEPLSRVGANRWRKDLTARLQAALPVVREAGLAADSSSSEESQWTLATAALVMDVARDRDRASAAQRTALLQTSWLQEAFFPDLSRGWAGLGLQALEGRIGDAVLIAPARFRFELDGRRVAFADQQGAEPCELARHQFDLCFPMTAVPLGRLRREFSPWREDRRYRRLGVLPFLFPKLSQIWDKHAATLAKLFPVREIYAFLPAQALWYKNFSQWAAKDWKHPEHLSVLWEISTGKVLAAKEVHERDKVRAIGKPFAKTT